MTPKQKIQKKLIDVSGEYEPNDLQRLVMEWASCNDEHGAELDTKTGDVYLTKSERYATMDELLDIMYTAVCWANNE